MRVEIRASHARPIRSPGDQGTLLSRRCWGPISDFQNQWEGPQTFLSPSNDPADVVADRNSRAAELAGQRSILSSPTAPSSLAYFCINCIKTRATGNRSLSCIRPGGRSENESSRARRQNQDSVSRQFELYTYQSEYSLRDPSRYQKNLAKVYGGCLRQDMKDRPRTTDISSSTS